MKATKISSQQLTAIKSDVKELSISKIVDVLIFQTDTLIISKAIGEIVVGIYSNYLLIIQGVNTFIGCISQGIQPTLTRFIMEKRENGEDYSELVSAYYMCFTFVSTLCFALFMALFQDVIAIWIGERFLLDETTVICLAVTQFFLIIDQPIWMLCYCSGMFKKIKQTGIVTASVNIVVSMLMVRWYGVLGVVLGTICCYVVSSILHLSVIRKIEDIEKSAINSFLYCWLFAIISTVIIGLLVSCVGKITNHFFDVGLERLVYKFLGSVLIVFVTDFFIFRRCTCFQQMRNCFRKLGKKEKIEGGLYGRK